MEKIKGLSIDLDIDHLAVDRGLKGLKDNLRTVNSEMRRNMSAFDYADRSVNKYQTRLDGLNRKLEVQKRAVEEARKEYEEMVKEHGRGSAEAEKAAREYNNQAAALNNLERYIERTREELARLEQEQRIANSSFTKVGQKMEDWGGKLKSVGGHLDELGGRMTRSITMPVLGVTTAVGGMVAAFGWGRLKSLDTAQAQLKGFGYTAQEVEVISEDVRNAVQGTTMTMAEGTSVAAGALAAGVKQGKELEKYIVRVGNAAVGSNRPVGEMAQIFNRVQGAGKLMTQELNQIEHGMPGFSQALAKHLGVAPEKLREMVTAGEVTSKDFMKVMDDFAGNMAKEYAKTWDGMVANTKANIGIIGENFLRGVFQDSKKSLADFIEMLKSPDIRRRAEEMGRVAQREFNRMKDAVVGVVEWYKNLDDGKKDLIKRLGLVVVAGGPTLQLFGKLTTGLGNVLEVTGKLSKAIGVARGAGLVAGLASLGPGAIAGVAVAGLTAVGVAAYALYKDTEKVKEVNLDVAESLTDQALSLQESADTFDKLSEKAKISNEELAELYDLNKRISQSANPGEIEQLQLQYDELAKKSGLSKDELQQLFKANENIIAQSPDVETSITNQGNEFVKSTDAVNEYIQSLLELSRQELSDEIAIAEENKQKILKENKQIREDIAKLDERSRELRELDALAEDERNQKLREWHTEIKQEMADSRTSQERLNELRAEEEIIVAFINDGLGAGLEAIREQRNELNEKLASNDEELAKIEALDQQMADIVLKQVGINEEGEKGLQVLDETIAKNEEELQKLNEKLEAGGKLTEEEQERYNKLYEATEKQREARDFLHDELEIYKDLNSLAEAKLEKADQETQKMVEALAAITDIKIEEGNIVKQIQDKNAEIDKSIEKLEAEKEKQGANKDEINAQISELKDKRIENDAVLEQILKELGVWEQVEDSLDLQKKKVDDKNKSVDDGTGKQKRQGDQIDANNRKTDEGIRKEQERTREAGKDVNKNVNVSDKGTVAKINREASSPRRKTVNLVQRGLAAINREASRPISKVINFVGRGLSKLKFWEKGTPPSGHPGGPAVIGERGSELTILPSGQAFLSPSSHTLLNLPKGTHVIPHHETKRIVGNAPRYADGTRDWSIALGNSNFARLLSANSRMSETSNPVMVSNNTTTSDDRLIALLVEQNQILMQLLNKNSDVYINGRVAGRLLEPVVTEIQKRNSNIDASFETKKM